MSTKTSEKTVYRLTPLAIIGPDASDRLLKHILKFQKHDTPVGVVVQYDELMGNNVLSFVDFKIDAP